MALLKTVFILAALALLSASAQSSNEAEKRPQQHQQQTQSLTSSTLNITNTQGDTPAAADITDTQTINDNDNNTRDARLMKIRQDPKALIARRYHAAVQRVIKRPDQLPHANRRSSVASPPGLMPHRGRPPMMRRIQHGPPAQSGLQRYTYETPKGVLNHPSQYSKGPVPFNAGKPPTFQRPSFVHTQQQKLPSHPNALIQKVTGPVQRQPHHQHQQQHQQQHQHQQQQHQQQQRPDEHNFKASPPFNGKAIVRPLLAPHDPNFIQHLQQLQQYGGGQLQLPIQQYPIPQQQRMQHQKHSAASFYPPSVMQTQSQASSSNQVPTFHYESLGQREEPILRPHLKHFPAPPSATGYAVYENNELDESKEEQKYAHPYAYYPPKAHAEEMSHVYPNLLESNVETAPIEEAEKYIDFMNTNEYFLPKHEPNYKQRDLTSGRQQKQQKQQESEQKREQIQQQTYIIYPRAHQTHYGKSAAASNAETIANYMNTPIQLSKLLYPEDPRPAVVRSSYQTGNNLFVVKSEGNKAVKHIVQSTGAAVAAATTTTTTTTPSPAYAKVRHNTPRSRTTEPERFEFTERDAMTSTAYTRSPFVQASSSSLSHGSYNDHLQYRTAAVGSSTTPNLPHLSNSNYFGATNLNSADDPEDEEDVQNESSSFYGRMPVRQSTLSDATVTPSSPPPAEQQDTEEYCERMCANVQDDDEEIVCGSDGYMYTSEAQMECYASCLHIDVNIQSKGSCSTR